MTQNDPQGLMCVKPQHNQSILLDLTYTVLYGNTFTECNYMCIQVLVADPYQSVHPVSNYAISKFVQVNMILCILPMFKDCFLSLTQAILCCTCAFKHWFQICISIYVLFALWVVYSQKFLFVFQNLGTFGPLKCREIYAIDKLQKQTDIIEGLVKIGKSGSEVDLHSGKL